MTRFMISLDDAVSMVWHAFDAMMGGEIFVENFPISIMDIAKAMHLMQKQKSWELGLVKNCMSK